jgi:hypothetical protein
MLNEFQIVSNLEGRCKFVGPEESWRRFVRRHLIEDWSDRGSTLVRAPSQSHLNRRQIGGRDPALSYQTLVGHVQVEEVEGVIDGFDLPHLDEPQLDILGGGGKNTLAVVVGLTDNGVL